MNAGSAYEIAICQDCDAVLAIHPDERMRAEVILCNDCKRDRLEMEERRSLQKWEEWDRANRGAPEWWR